MGGAGGGEGGKKEKKEGGKKERGLGREGRERLLFQAQAQAHSSFFMKNLSLSLWN